jgi:hypothetical protein
VPVALLVTRQNEQLTVQVVVTDECLAHVLTTDAATAERAVKELDGLEVMGRQLRADHAQKKDGGGGGGRGGGGYGGGKCTLSAPSTLLTYRLSVMRAFSQLTFHPHYF